MRIWSRYGRDLNFRHSRHFSALHPSFVVLIKVIAGLLVVIKGPCLEILSFRLLGLLVRQFGGMAPFAFFLVLPDLPVGLSDRGSLDDKGRGKDHAMDRTLAPGAGSQNRFGHPLDDFEPRVTVAAPSLWINSLVSVSRHRSLSSLKEPFSYHSKFSLDCQGEGRMLRKIMMIPYQDLHIYEVSGELLGSRDYFKENFVGC